MLIIFQILSSLFLALIVGSFFYYIFKYTGPWGSFWSFLLVLILAGFAASVWIEPFGPVLYDVSWAPILVVILIFALLLAATSPKKATRYKVNEKIIGKEEKDSQPLALSVVFWLFLIVLLTVALMGVFRNLNYISN